jgi:hypothetical protein
MAGLTFLREDIALVKVLMNDFLRLRHLLLFLATTVCLGGIAFADSWTQPTPEELKMTSEPGVPDAVAVFLYREERADDKLHMHSVYVRLKILTDKGKEYADVELPYEGRSFSIRAIEGRTIHSDGSVIPFTGKPYDKLLEKSKTTKYKAKVFTLPDAQVGSILEYRYEVSYDDGWVYSPEWYIQLPLYVRKAHYQFAPTEHRLDDGHGGSKDANVAYSPMLPKGVEVKYLPMQSLYTLDVEKIAPMQVEDYMPPMHSLTYRVLFYYTLARTSDEYWKTEGKYWSRDIDKFMNAEKLGPIVSQIVAPSDTPRQKAHKIYEAVMKLDNTSFSRGHSGAEDKAEGLRIKTAANIWEAKRGDADEITILFVGLARAAGLKAYVEAVTNRDRAFFLQNYLSLNQLDDDMAIIELDGKEEFFDPGERYCGFGDLHWKHTLTKGLRQTDHGAEVAETPSLGYKATTILRTADLYMEADGKVHGMLRVTLTGNEALIWRQRALNTDEEAIKREFEESIQEQVPPGVEVKTDHFLGLTDYDKTLMAVMNVTGSMGTATSKRVFLPAVFFEAGSKPLFVHDTRNVPIDLRYPYGAQDSVVIHLPPTLAVESAPKDAQIPLPKNALYQATFKLEPGKLQMGRVFILANSLFTAEEYSGVKDFYQKVNAKDQEQAVLQPAPGASVAAGGAK